MTPEFTNARWFKSSASSVTGCVEVAHLPNGLVALRDSKDVSKYLRGFSSCSDRGCIALLVAVGAVVAAEAAYVLNTLWVKDRGGKTLVIVSSVVLVLAIGVSRLYLGVHYFSDVVGGYAAGLVWLAACISGVEIARRRAALIAAAGLDVASQASVRT